MNNIELELRERRLQKHYARGMLLAAIAVFVAVLIVTAITK